MARRKGSENKSKSPTPEEFEESIKGLSNIALRKLNQLLRNPETTEAALLKAATLVISAASDIYAEEKRENVADIKAKLEKALEEIDKQKAATIQEHGGVVHKLFQNKAS